jgi:hypothetical protein
MTQFRCTRNTPYEKGCPGYDNLSARQGYYITAETEHEAYMEMARRFPGDHLGFAVQVWKEDRP